LDFDWVIEIVPKLYQNKPSNFGQKYCCWTKKKITLKIVTKNGDLVPLEWKLQIQISQTGYSEDSHECIHACNLRILTSGGGGAREREGTGEGKKERIDVCI